jgi:50S ribosomal subunit-associated GTPase HflX
MEAADILVWLTAADVGDMTKPLRKPDILVMNKADLQIESMAEYMIRMRNDSVLIVSVKTGDGMAALSERLTGLVVEKLGSV